LFDSLAFNPLDQNFQMLGGWVWGHPMGLDGEDSRFWKGQKQHSLHHTLGQNVTFMITKIRL
jgi:hypothetical protein